MWSLGFAIILRRKAHCQGVLDTEGDRGLERRLGSESEVSIVSDWPMSSGRATALVVATHVSLCASPTPFLLLMEMLASSKLHEEAA